MSVVIGVEIANILAPWKPMLLKAKLRNIVRQKKKKRLCGNETTIIGREEELLLDEVTGDAEGPKGRQAQMRKNIDSNERVMV